MVTVTVLAESDEPEPVVYAYARRTNYGLGAHGLRAEPWIEIGDLALTEQGKQNYGSPTRLLVGTAFTLACEDGLCFVGCKVGTLTGPSARFLAMDVLGADGNSLLG